MVSFFRLDRLCVEIRVVWGVWAWSVFGALWGCCGGGGGLFWGVICVWMCVGVCGVPVIVGFVGGVCVVVLDCFSCRRGVFRTMRFGIGCIGICGLCRWSICRGVGRRLRGLRGSSCC